MNKNIIYLHGKEPLPLTEFTITSSCESEETSDRKGSMIHCLKSQGRYKIAPLCPCENDEEDTSYLHIRKHDSETQRNCCLELKVPGMLQFEQIRSYRSICRWFRRNFGKMGKWDHFVRSVHGKYLHLHLPRSYDGTAEFIRIAALRYVFTTCRWNIVIQEYLTMPID